MSASDRWQQITIEVGADAVERLSECFEVLGALSVSLRSSGSGEPLIAGVDGESLWSRTQLSGLFPASSPRDLILAAASDVLGLAGPPAYAISTIEAQDWTQTLQAAFKPRCFGGRLWVCPSWSQLTGDEAWPRIILDPGMAFGTGAHATTAMCLEWLCDQPDLAGTRLIDYGCGSGILAIAAAKLGAGEVWALDKDPLACEVAAHNVVQNDVADIVSVHASDELQADSAHMLIANIFLDALLGLAPRLGALLKARGKLLLAGITATQTELCRAAYLETFDVRAPITREDWVCLPAERRSREA